MPLEQAGVELIAKNYRQYMEQLRQIDKTQQQVFNNPNRGTENALRRHNQQVRGLQDAYRGLQKIIALVFASQVIRQGAQEIERALDFRRVSTQFRNFANSSGQSANELVSAMKTASHGMISNADAVSRALAIMRLEVATTPEKLAEFVRLGVALRPAGQDAASAIEQLTVALGRNTLRVLDNFNISQKRARIEMEKMAQQRFGASFDDLPQVEQGMIFVDAALKAMRQDFQEMGGDIEEITNNAEILKAKFDDLKLVMGEALVPGAQDFSGVMAEVLDTFTKIIAIAAAGEAGIRAWIKTISQGAADMSALVKPGGLTELIGGVVFRQVTGKGPDLKDLFDQALLDAQDAATERMKELLKTMGIFTDETIQAGDALDDTGGDVENLADKIKAMTSAVEQAQSIYRSFARAQEDALRRAGRQADQLQRKQAKELVKLAKDRDKDLADLVKERTEDEVKAEKDANKAIQRSKDDLYQQLRHAQERYELSVLQDRRRFNLQDRRLRAEGDILALRDLRENYDLQQKEDKENFDLSQRQMKESGQDKIEQQQADQQEQLKEIQNDIEKRRQELLNSYDDELAQLQEAHAEQREEQARSLAEQLEDLRLNRQRQLEDLGYHMAQQEDITREGAQNVAEELEKIFGVDGVADLIMQGYAERTEGRFADMFRSIEQMATTAQPAAPAAVPALTPRQQLMGIQHGFSGVVTGPQGFMVEPGVREFVYAAPLSGGGAGRHDILELAGGATFNITGAEGASAGAVDAATERMATAFEIAMRRLARRG